ncbi:MAG TPA: response regulator [Ferruginibacter sp.]|nr:response regulator [Ferruginibacter sp.]
MSSPKSILIVDDDNNTLHILSLILQNAGYDVQVDESGNLSFLQTGIFPDLILLDCNLGSKDGSNICRELKTAAATKHIPIIIISAMPDIKNIFIEAKADNYLSKPFGINQLLKIIGQTLNTEIPQ